MQLYSYTMHFANRLPRGDGKKIRLPNFVPSFRQCGAVLTCVGFLKLSQEIVSVCEERNISRPPAGARSYRCRRAAYRHVRHSHTVRPGDGQ